MIAQEGLFEKKGVIPLKYDALRICMKALAEDATLINASIHMPRIGTGQAKGDWNIIEGIIHDELVTKNLDVSIYIPPGTKSKPTPKKQSNLTLFDDSEFYEK